MASSKIIVLPTPDEILRRLSSVGATKYSTEKLYSALRENAGEELLAVGVAVMFANAYADCATRVPAIAADEISRYLPAFVAALVGDKEVCDEVLAIMRRTGTIA